MHIPRVVVRTLITCFATEGKLRRAAGNFRVLAVLFLAFAVIGCPQAQNPEALKKQADAERVLADATAKAQADAAALRAEVEKMKADAAAKELADAKALADTNAAALAKAEAEAKAQADADAVALAEADRAVAAAEAEARSARSAAQSNRGNKVSSAKADRAEAAARVAKGRSDRLRAENARMKAALIARQRDDDEIRRREWLREKSRRERERQAEIDRINQQVFNLLNPKKPAGKPGFTAINPTATPKFAPPGSTGPAGGTVRGGGATVSIPPGALPNNVKITVTGRPGAVSFSPDGLKFKKPVRITIPLKKKMPLNTKLNLRHNPSGDIVKATVIAPGNKATALVMHFSEWEIEETASDEEETPHVADETSDMAPPPDFGSPEQQRLKAAAERQQAQIEAGRDVPDMYVNEDGMYSTLPEELWTYPNRKDPADAAADVAAQKKAADDAAAADAAAQKKTADADAAADAAAQKKTADDAAAADAAAQKKIADDAAAADAAAQKKTADAATAADAAAQKKIADDAAAADAAAQKKTADDAAAADAAEAKKQAAQEAQQKEEAEQAARKADELRQHDEAVAANAAKEQAAQEKAAEQQAAKEQAAQERAAEQQAAKEQAAQERAAEQQAAKEQAAQERAEQQRAAQEQAAQERAEQQQQQEQPDQQEAPDDGDTSDE